MSSDNETATPVKDAVNAPKAGDAGNAGNVRTDTVRSGCVTIIPTDNVKNARALFKQMVQAPDTLLLVILGNDSQSQNANDYANALGNTVVEGFTRTAAWVQDKTFYVTNLFKGMGISAGDSGFSINNIDNIDTITAFSISPDTKEIQDIIQTGDTIDPMRIEQAFLRAGA